MTHKPTAVTTVLFAVLYLLSSCKNHTNAPAQSDHAQKAEAHSQQSMAMMQTMDAMMQRMTTMKMTGDHDVDFANRMIDHHQGAIDMSEIELKSGSDSQMKGMAQKIITAQQAEIAKLRNFVQAHPPTNAQQQQMQQSMHNEPMQMMHNQMKAVPMGSNVDQGFANMMMAHHRGAITMAQEEIAKGQHTEIKQMAQQMINDQQREIAEFQAWLDKNRK